MALEMKIKDLQNAICPCNNWRLFARSIFTVAKYLTNPVKKENKLRINYRGYVVPKRQYKIYLKIDDYRSDYE